MRRAGGTGTIGKSNRPLRKPYFVRVTERTWHDENGKKHEKKKLLGYYETKKEAQEALEAYNHNKEHVNLEFSKIKFNELWDKWQNTKDTNSLSDSTLKGYKFCYDKITDNIKFKIFVNINFDDLQNMINVLRNDGKKYDTLRKIKNSLSQLYDYAIKCDIIDKNYAKLLDVGKSSKKGETLILKDELKQVRKLIQTEKNEDTLITLKIIYMLCFNGCRISEFLDLKTEDIDLQSRTFRVKESKTQAGVRTVPIHIELLNIYQSLYNPANEYFLINPRTHSKFSYANFRDSFWDRLRYNLDWNEELTPHNCRKTCASLMKRFDVDSTYQKLILGHEGALDLTEKVYTHIDDSQLVYAIDKIDINLL